MNWILFAISLVIVALIALFYKKRPEACSGIFIVSVIIAMLGVGILTYVGIKSSVDNSNYIIDECIVENKHYKQRRRWSDVNYLDLTWQNEEQKSGSVTLIVDRAFYEAVNIGDEIECEIWYDDDGIVMCKIIEDKKKGSG